jgi:cytochrome c
MRAGNRTPGRSPIRRPPVGAVRRLLVAAVPAAVLLAGCRFEEREVVAGGGAPGSAAAAARFADHDAGAAPGGPGAGQRYGLGRAATPAQVAAWDVDVGPDGAELPPGSGTAADGRRLYAAKCAACHGANGEGMLPAYPVLVGRPEAAEGFRFASDPKLEKTIGNYWSHATTVFDYVKRAMPLTAPGSLADDEVYAITAYLLAANKVLPADATLDAERLRQVKMPYADRFVPDDRTGGPGAVK